MKRKDQFFNEKHYLYRFDRKLRYVAYEIKYYTRKNPRSKANHDDVVAVINDFIATFQPIEFGFFRLGFDRHNRFAVLPPIQPTATLDNLYLADFGFELFGPETPYDVISYEKERRRLADKRRWSDEEWNYVSLWDFVTAYQLKSKICSILGVSPPSPKFEHALVGMSKIDADGYIVAILPYLPQEK